MGTYYFLFPVFFIITLYICILTGSYIFRGALYTYIEVSAKRRKLSLNIISFLILPILDRALLSLVIYRINYIQKNELIGRILTNIGYFLTGVEIYHNAKIGKGFQLWHGQGTVIGQNAVIGENCLMLNQVTLGAGFVVIGSNVKIGVGAKILGSITIGDDCVVGANCVVTTDLPPCTLVKLECTHIPLDPAKKIYFGTRS